MIKKILISLGLFAFISLGILMLTDEGEGSHVKGSSPPDFSGFAVKVEEHSFLLTGRSDTGGYTAIYLSTTDLDQQSLDIIKQGAYLAVWIDGAVMESYPMQAKVKRLESHLTPYEHPQAKRQAEEILAEALDKLIQTDIQGLFVPGVDDMRFDPQEMKWHIVLIDLMHTDQPPIEVSILD